jgi:hypothetical protein
MKSNLENEGSVEEKDRIENRRVKRTELSKVRSGVSRKMCKTGWRGF